MSQRELVVLGSGSQVPTRYRNQNGYLLLFDDEGLLFDPGEGTQRQLTTFGCAVSRITRICITHFHGDHCLGLPGVLQRLSLDQVSHEVSVHYPASGQAYYDRLRRASIYQDVAKIRAAPIKGDGLLVEGPLRLWARALSHAAPSFGYRLEEPDRLAVDPAALARLGLRGPKVGELLRQGRVEHEGRQVEVEEVAEVRRGQVVAVIMDTRLCDAAFELARGADLVVAEATFCDSEASEARDYGHLTAREAARIAAEGGARALLLTHFSRRYPNTDQHLAEAQEVFEASQAAYDGLRVPLPPRPARPARRQLEPDA